MSDEAPFVENFSHPALSWYSPGKVMHLRLAGNYGIEDSLLVNAAITSELDRSSDELILLIDATEMDRPYHFDQLRATQTYKDHQKLKHIYVAAQDRIVRLALMIIFNISRAHFHLFDDIDMANNVLNAQINHVR